MTSLTTARLRLEPMTDAHLHGLFEMNRDLDVMRYITGKPDTLEDTQAMIDRVKARWAEWGYSWWTFFDVRSAGYSTGTDYDSPTKSMTSYIFEFGSARWGSGAWPGAVRTPVPKVGLDPQRVVDRETDQAVTALPVPSSLKRY